MNKKKTIAVAAVLALILIIGGLLAYFTDHEDRTNTFTVGNVNITLTETGWDALTDTDEDGIPDVAETVVPGKVITKDPKVAVNAGSNPAFLFMSVDVPAITTQEVVNEQVVYNCAAGNELFSYTLGTGWVEIESLKSVTSGNVKHVYVYGTASAATAVAAGTNVPELFTTVTVKSDLTNTQVTANFTGEQDVVVNAYGIQTTDLGTTTPAAIYEMVLANIEA